ncbi:hypothetical protein UlMin_006090 [Ulmus minor]
MSCSTKSTSIFFFLLFFLFLFSTQYFTTLAEFDQSEIVLGREETHIPFSYDERTGRGPSKWGYLNETWYLCKNGTKQSPINIDKRSLKVYPKLGELKRDYKPASATLENRGYEISVIWKKDAGKITINGSDYRLLQCHWHTPSEHKINGESFDLELHMVHQNNTTRQIAVVGILYKYGPSDPFLSLLYKQIRKLHPGIQKIDLGNVYPGDVEFSKPSRSKKYYRYSGSLTTPPCSENVIWTLLHEVRTVSKEQVEVLKKAVYPGYEKNARPTQPLNGRKVFLYNPWFNVKPTFDQVIQYLNLE